MAAPQIKGWLHHYLDLAVAAVSPVPGKKFVLAGSEVPWDSCDCNGQIWSRIVNIQPIVGTTKANGQPCVIRFWEVTLAVGILRCVAVPSESGKLPTGTRMTTDGDQAADDLANLIQAIVCDPATYNVTQAAPIGAQGGCAGSEVQFIIRLNPCDCG